MEGVTERHCLTPELIEKARVELNEVQSQVPDEIRALRETILKDPTLNFRTDDAFLLRFLRARKFDQKRALEIMKNYYKNRDRNPQFFKRTTADLESALSAKTQGGLPARDRNGCAIIVINVCQWNPSLVNFEDFVANFVLTLERLVEDGDVQINGIVVICNMKGFNLRQLCSLNPLTIKRFVDSVVNAFPVRYKAIHYVNESDIFHAGFLLLKPFLGKKILSRIKFHGRSFGTLHDHFSPEILPEELGGFLERYDNSEWNRILEEHQKTAKRNLTFGFQRQI